MSMESNGRMVSVGKLLICPPELWQFYQHSHLVANQEKLDEGNDEFGLIFVHTSKGFLTCSKVL
jgi:hypothetical protein